MEQRVYYGNINPHALADYLVGAFQQPQPAYYQPQDSARAQKIMQGERIYVQVMRNSDLGLNGRKAIGVYIMSIPGGVSVEMGASDWLNVDGTGLAIGLIGALFFPPLLLFPLLQGLAGSGFSYEVWNVVETYCVQGSPRQGYGQQQSQPGFYCTYCGAFNHPGSPRCHACHAPFNVAQPESAAGTPEPELEAQPEAVPERGEQPKKGDTRPMFALVICPSCKATVMPARFCGNCAAPLSDESEE